jgi:toxin ParE1/3/4
MLEYLARGGEGTAARFIDAVEETLEAITLAPEAGSTRASLLLDLPGLRSWIVGSFPWTIFYVHGDGVVDVWRILHQRMDIPAWLDQDPRA